MVCSIDDCDRPHHGRGLCHNHLQALHIHGDPTKLVFRETPNTYVADWEEVDRGFDSLCYWVPGTNRIRIRAKALLASLPERPPGMVYMHLCEKWGEPNRCVRPEHIKVGTRAENNAHKEALRAAAGVPHHSKGKKRRR